MPQHKRTEILESQIRELRGQLAVVMGILTDFALMDDQKTCPYCQKDEWGTDAHEPTCIMTRIYEFLENPHGEAEAMLELKQAVLELCLAFAYSANEPRLVDRSMVTVMHLVGLNPEPVENRCH